METDSQEVGQDRDGAKATPARQRRRRLPVVNPQRCTGCGRCVAACAPLQLLSLEVRQWKKTAVLHSAGACTGCSLCALRCPFDAIQMQRPGSSG